MNDNDSAIAALLSERGCDCNCHPDELPDGVEPCLPCRAEAEWKALVERASWADQRAADAERWRKIAMRLSRAK